ncbi:MAG TPA: glutathione S-transferase family protein [Burkholderiales bacterium]|nr:glutathione S-transferase family protein [Burkholderiales bacterium]
MKLYYLPPSGNAHKVRILLALLGVPYEKAFVDGKTQAHKSPEFRKLSPRGEVPVLEDDGTVLWDSAACLVYLARKYGGEQWLPGEPAQMGEVMQWVALAGNEIQFGLQYARRGVLQDRWTAGTLEQGHALGRIALDVLQGRLASHDWLALDRPTIADVACFPYIETAPEAKLALEPWPAVQAWLARCKALPQWPEREKTAS